MNYSTFCYVLRSVYKPGTGTSFVVGFRISNVPGPEQNEDESDKSSSQAKCWDRLIPADPSIGSSASGHIVLLSP